MNLKKSSELILTKFVSIFIYPPDIVLPTRICRDYEHVSSSSEYHPFNAQGYDIPKPEIQLVYGFPNHIPQTSSNELEQSSPSQLPIQSIYSSSISTTNDDPIYPTQTTTNLIDTTTTDTAIVDNDATTILTGDSLNSHSDRIHKRSIFYSQTPKSIEITTELRPTTTTRPRTRYDDEGKWKIIRQEEKKQRKQYDYL